MRIYALQGIDHRLLFLHGLYQGHDELCVGDAVVIGGIGCVGHVEAVEVIAKPLVG